MKIREQITRGLGWYDKWHRLMIFSILAVNSLVALLAISYVWVFPIAGPVVVIHIPPPNIVRVICGVTNGSAVVMLNNKINKGSWEHTAIWNNRIWPNPRHARPTKSYDWLHIGECSRPDRNNNSWCMKNDGTLERFPNEDFAKKDNR